MRDFKETVSANILALRLAAGMTQAELAEKLNYTDKAVSKWEHGEAMPDIGTLAEICRLFGVTMDALVNEPLDDFDRKRKEEEAAERAREEKQRKWTRIIITAMSVCLVWLIAVFVFITWHVAGGGDANAWLAYVYAVPVSAIVMLVLVSIWFRRPLIFESLLTLSAIMLIR